MGYCDSDIKCIRITTIVVASVICVVVLFYCLNSNNQTNKSTIVQKDYNSLINEIIQEEEQLRIGHRIQLNDKELFVNRYFRDIRMYEYDVGIKAPSKFYASQPIFKVKTNITNSEVFKFLKRMPKGGLLHVHDTAASSHEFLFNLTYESNLYICLTNRTVRFQFAVTIPIIKFENLNCTWQLLSDVREKSDNVTQFNQQLREYMTLVTDGNFREKYPTSADVWAQFDELYNVMRTLLTYRPVFEKVWYNFLKELHLDNVQYVEVRSSLKPLYELNGTIHNETEVVNIVKNVVEQFKRDYQDFFDVKIIYSKSKVYPTLKQYIETYKKIKNNASDFIIGFDLVGHEDSMYPLKTYLNELKQMPANTHYFFHAGETNFFGTDVDWNLVDAVLLKSKRVAHAYAILKHPKILQMLRKNNIGIEISPISSQVLGYVSDLRNHPATVLLATDHPIAIGNDDPAFWGVQGVTYDFYEAIMAFLSRDNDLKAVKQLVMNSVDLSDLEDHDKSELRKLVTMKWNNFIDEIVNERNKSVLFSKLN